MARRKRDQVKEPKLTSNESRDSIKNIWGTRKPYFGEWPERIDEHLNEKPDKWVQSACVLWSYSKVS